MGKAYSSLVGHLLGMQKVQSPVPPTQSNTRQLYVCEHVFALVELSLGNNFYNEDHMLSGPTWIILFFSPCLEVGGGERGRIPEMACRPAHQQAAILLASFALLCFGGGVCKGKGSLKWLPVNLDQGC